MTPGTPANGDVSIHAPAWRATPGVCGVSYSTMKSFQSTPPHGGRRDRDIVSAFATRFNPRPRMEGDTASDMIRARYDYGFNPRPRMEGDRVGRIRYRFFLGFNPRPRMEGDGADVQAGSTVDPFQSTPPHGGRHI